MLYMCNTCNFDQSFSFPLLEFLKVNRAKMLAKNGQVMKINMQDIFIFIFVKASYKIQNQIN